MSLTHLQYRKVIWFGMLVVFVLFTSVEFMSNLMLHLKHDQTMPAALGLAFIGTIVYALVMAVIVIVLGVVLTKISRTILAPDTKGNDHE
jgi:Na+-transporting NADH:ubiquinone oxidoreductase subunit NqrE